MPHHASNRSVFGIGLFAGGIAGVYLAAVLALRAFNVIPPVREGGFLVKGYGEVGAWVVGVACAVAGVIAYIFVWRQLLRARRSGELLTDGVFRYVRHPLYSIALFLITPGVLLPTRDWPILFTCVVLYAAFLLLIPFEERSLVRAFGDAYRAYQKRTSMLVPWRPREDVSEKMEEHD